MFACKFPLPSSSRGTNNRGMALVLVLWIVAALSIFTLGLSSVLRQEAAMVNVSRNMAYGRAAGEAAIFEAMQRMAVHPQAVDGIVTQSVVFMGKNIELQIIPWSGFININAASASLLALLFQRAAQMPAGSADALAQTLVDARESLRVRSSGSMVWDAPEDLLQIPGMTYAVFSLVREYLVAEPGGRQGISSAAALQPLRAWVEGGGTSAWQLATTGTQYTIAANVLFEGQGVVRVVRQVSVGRSAGPGRLPWQLHAATQTWIGSL